MVFVAIRNRRLRVCVYGLWGKGYTLVCIAIYLMAHLPPPLVPLYLYVACVKGKSTTGTVYNPLVPRPYREERAPVHYVYTRFTTNARVYNQFSTSSL